MSWPTFGVGDVADDDGRRGMKCARLY
jgi:hypothetical protein